MRSLRSISLQSKLLATVLALVLSAIAIVAWLGYTSARDSLRASALGQVQSMQRAKSAAVASAFGAARNEVLALSAMPQVGAAASELLAACARRALAAAAAFALIASLLAVWFAGRIARPLERLVQGARRITTGDLDTPVPFADGPEFRALGQAFNDMAGSLRGNRDRMQEQVRETERLLSSLLPGPGAAQVREGRQDEPQAFADVTVAFVNLTGIDAHAGGGGCAR